MNREAWESVIVSDRAAAALATRVDRDLREERGLWRRYLSFLDGEGFDARSRMIAEHVDGDDDRRGERLFTLLLVALLTACLAALVFARSARASTESRPAEPAPVEISVADVEPAPFLPVL